MAVVHATAPYSSTNTVIPDQPPVTNPLESDVVQRWLGWTPALLAAAILLALTSLVLRRRRAVGRERRQLDVVLLGALGTLVLLVAALLTPAPWFLVVMALALVPYPLALGAAAARHQLWNLDLVVRRSVVYGTLSVAVVAAYVGSIAALGGVLGRTTGAPLVATAVVAVGAAPFVARVQRAVDRRLFGDSADPAAAMRRLARGAGTLPELARDVAASLRVPHARIVTATGQTGAWGTPRDPETRVALRHGEAVVGELVTSAREPGRPLTKRDEATLTELASYVAVVVHALQLSDDLQRSREQIVVAREEERRRLRRDLHDGARARARRDRARAGDGARPRGGPGDAGRREGRVAARACPRGGVRRPSDRRRPAPADARRPRPGRRGRAAGAPALDARPGRRRGGRGPATAVRGRRARRAADRGRGDPPTWCHSGARHARVAVGWADGLVEVVVADDGRGFDAGASTTGVGLGSMRERALELGGSCTVESAPGRGTTVHALLPAPGAAR